MPQEDDADDTDGPEVKLVVVEKFESETAKNSALDWSLKHGELLSGLAVDRTIN